MRGPLYIILSGFITLAIAGMSSSSSFVNFIIK